MATQLTQEVQIQVNVSEDKRAGHYSNLFSVTTNTAGETIIDFIFTHMQDKTEDGKQVGTLVSRVIMPINLGKALKMALEAQLGKNQKE